MRARPGTFLDSNAGAPLRQEVVTALLPFLQGGGSFPFSNPSSTHSGGRRARNSLTHAAQQVSRSLGPSIRPEELLFTSSGTEANQSAIRGVLEPLLNEGRKPHWITTRLEHDSVARMAVWLEGRGGAVDYLPVECSGRVRLEDAEGLIRPETALVSILWANNETGVLQELDALRELALRLEGAGSVPLHLDGAQAWGKIPLDLRATGASLASFSGHKIGALPGTGVLWIREGTKLEPLLPGHQQRGRRGGTENLPGIVSLGAAAAALGPSEWSRQVAVARTRLEGELVARIPGARINGVESLRIANTSSVSFQGLKGADLVMALDLEGFAVGSGPACSSGIGEPSKTLLAMGRSPDEALSSIRISMAEALSDEEQDAFLSALDLCVRRLSGVEDSPMTVCESGTGGDAHV